MHLMASAAYRQRYLQVVGANKIVAGTGGGLSDFFPAGLFPSFARSHKICVPSMTRFGACRSSKIFEICNVGAGSAREMTNAVSLTNRGALFAGRARSHKSGLLLQMVLQVGLHAATDQYPHHNPNLARIQLPRHQNTPRLQVNLHPQTHNSPEP